MALYELDGHRVQLPAPGRYWIADKATVIGRVTIGEDVSVWFDAVIRGDNEPIVIGARSNIQEGCILHVDPGFPLIIGEEATVGHQAMLHGCTIGKGALIGIGAKVLNGARVGDGAIVGAHSLVGEGREIAAGMLAVGAPAKVIRAVSDADRARVEQGVADYMRRWRYYAAKLRPQP